MNRIIFVSTLFSIFTLQAGAQGNYNTPKGFRAYKDYNGKPVSLTGDFDGDGIKDLAIVLSQNGPAEASDVGIFLSSAYYPEKRVYHFPFSSNSCTFAFTNRVLTIEGCFGTGRYCKTLKFRYQADIASMRLIGYEEESFGNAVHDGAYVKSINLLTDKYELTGPKWKNKIFRSVSFNVITLEMFTQEAMDALEEVGAEYVQ